MIRGLVLAVAAASFFLVACGDDDDAPAATPTSAVTQTASESAPLAAGASGTLAGLTITAESLTEADGAWDVRVHMVNDGGEDGALPPEFLLACGGAEPVPATVSDAEDALSLSGEPIPAGEEASGTLRFNTPNPCTSGVLTAQALGAFTGMVGGVPNTLRWALTAE